MKISHNLSSRIDEGIYEKLVSLANTKGISMNSLVNSILKHYVIWDQFTQEMGLVPLTKRTLKKIFRAMDDKTIKKIAHEVGGRVPQELIYLSYDKFDFVDIMKMIEISDSRFGIIRSHQNDSVHSINIIHGICENFSKFLIETHQTLANKLELKFHVEHMDDNMVCIDFQNSKKS